MLRCRWRDFIFLLITLWESSAITNKRSAIRLGDNVRNFRHIAGPSSAPLGDWEVGLREAVHQALLREGYHDRNLRDRIFRAPLLGKQDSASPFGDVAILARGQLYALAGENFAFVQDPYSNDCDECHNSRKRRMCGTYQCDLWRPQHHERLLALWTVKRLRHRSNNNYHYEVEYTVSPMSSIINEAFVTRNGKFDYTVPGHVFVIKNNVNKNQPTESFKEIYNRKIPHDHFNPEILIAIDSNGNKHFLHSYPAFFTSLPVHPTYQEYSTNNPREIELYKKLIASLAEKTSTTKKEEGPFKVSLNHIDDTTKPTYEKYPTTVQEMTPLTPMYVPVMILQPTKMNTLPILKPTKPTILKPQTETHVQTDNVAPQTTQPIKTTIHYFVPVGEEVMTTKPMEKIAIITKPTHKTTSTTEDLGPAFLFPGYQTSTPTPTNKYNSTKVTVTDVTDSDFLFPKPTKIYSVITSKLPVYTESSITTKKTPITSNKPWQTTISTTKPMPISKFTMKHESVTPQTSTSINNIIIREKVTHTSAAPTSTKPTTIITKPSKSIFKSKKPTVTTSTTTYTKTTVTATKPPTISSSMITHSKMPLKNNMLPTISTPQITTNIAKPSTSQMPFISKITRLSTTAIPKPSQSTESSTSLEITKPYSTVTRFNRPTPSTLEGTYIFPTVTKPFSTTLKITSSSEVSKGTQTSETTKHSLKPFRTTTKILKPVTTPSILMTNVTRRKFNRIPSRFGMKVISTTTTVPILISKYTTFINTPIPTSSINFEKSTLSNTNIAHASDTFAESQITTQEMREITDKEYETFSKVIPTEPMNTVTRKPVETKLETMDQTKHTDTTVQFSTTTTSILEQNTSMAFENTTPLPNLHSDTLEENLTSAETNTTLNVTKPENEITNGVIINTTEYSTDYTEKVTEVNESFQETMESPKDTTLSVKETTEEIYTTHSTASMTTEMYQETNTVNKNPTQNNEISEETSKESIHTSDMYTKTDKTTQATTKAMTTKIGTMGTLKPSLETSTSSFLTDGEPVNEPINIKPVRKDYDEDDIFGTTKFTGKPSTSSTVAHTENELAMELFNKKKRRRKAKTNPKVIFSNFYEASTTYVPPSTIPIEMTSHETDSVGQPLTSQSVETSISYEVNKKNKTSMEYLPPTRATVNEIMRSKDYTVYMAESPSSISTENSKKIMDDIAMQLVNHARTINYLNQAENKTSSKPKYKKRRNYRPRNRKSNERKKE